MYILIVEDEFALADTLYDMMREQHYTADVVYTGEDGLTYGESNLYDVILLDVMLPGMDGFEVVKQLREKKIKTPVILLTAKDDTADKVYGLDCGADDYITKPFSKEELFARIRSNSRRQGQVVLDEVVCDDLTLNLSNHELTCNNKSVRLGYKEFEIIKILAMSPGKVISKNEILVKVWGFLTDAEENNVEVYISFLRKKMTFLGTKVSIEVIRKIGYRLKLQSTGGANEN